jgi:hypothetical protein
VGMCGVCWGGLSPVTVRGCECECECVVYTLSLLVGWTTTATQLQLRCQLRSAHPESPLSLTAATAAVTLLPLLVLPPSPPPPFLALSQEQRGPCVQQARTVLRHRLPGVLGAVWGVYGGAGLRETVWGVGGSKRQAAV